MRKSIRPLLLENKIYSNQRFLLLIILSCIILANGYSQTVNLATWILQDRPESDRILNTLPVSYKAENITVDGITRGDGVTNSAAAHSYGGANFVSTTLAEAISLNKYFTVSITPDEKHKVSIKNIGVYNIKSSTSGPTGAQWQYSIDNEIFTNIGSAIVVNSSTAVSNNQPAIDLSNFSELQEVQSGKTITFRLVPYSTKNSSGTFYFYAPNATTTFNINGTIVQILYTDASITDITSSSAKVVLSNVGNGGTSLTSKKVYYKKSSDLEYSSSEMDLESNDITISSLEERTTYNYYIELQNEAGEFFTSQEADFTTFGSGPEVIPSITSYDFGEINPCSGVASTTITIQTVNLTEDLAVTLDNTSSAYTIDASSITQSATTTNIEVTFSPVDQTTYNNSIIISGDGISDVSISLTGIGKYNQIETPQNITTSQIKAKSFTTSFDTSCAASHYKVDVYNRTIASDELIFNGGFEDGITYWSTLSNTNFNASLINSNNSNAHNGNSYFRKTTTGVVYLDQTIKNIEIGEKYLLSFYYNNYDASNNNGIKNYSYHGSTTNYIDSGTPKLPAANKWTKYEKEFVSEATEVKISIRAYQACIIDDLSLVKITKSPIENTPIETTQTELTMSNLTPESTYYYTVTATRNDEETTIKSASSTEFTVHTLAMASSDNGKTYNSIQAALTNAEKDGYIITLNDDSDEEVIINHDVSIRSADQSIKGVNIEKGTLSVEGNLSTTNTSIKIYPSLSGLAIGGKANVSSGAIIASSNLYADVNISEFTTANKWAFLALPFDVALIKYIKEDDSEGDIYLSGTNFNCDIRTYNSKNRANSGDGQGAWNYTTDITQVKKGTGFIVKVYPAEITTGILRFYATTKKIDGDSKTVAAEFHSSTTGSDWDTGWNLFGLPTANVHKKGNGNNIPEFLYYANGSDNAGGYGTEFFEADSEITPYTAYFGQIWSDNDFIFGAVNAPTLANRKSVLTNEEQIVYRFNLYNGVTLVDKVGLIFRSSASNQFKYGEDARKISIEGSNVIWNSHNGINYAFNRLPFIDGAAYKIKAGIEANSNSKIEKISNSNNQTVLIKEENGTWHDLTAEDYIIEQRSNTQIREFEVKICNHVVTTLKDLKGNSIIISTENNCINIANIEIGETISIVNIDGRLFNTIIAGSSNISTNIPQGIYLLRIGETTSKVVVK